jgi:hypothetical protein
MVTIELAIGLVTAVTLAASLAGISLLGVAQATVAESSAQLARQTARGDDAAVWEAQQRVPEGAEVDVRRESDGVTATVRLAVRVAGLGPVKVEASSWAAYEPGVGR